MHASNRVERFTPENGTGPEIFESQGAGPSRCYSKGTTKNETRTGS